MANDIILCYSGGLDSLVAWHYLGKPKSIYFACSKYAPVEMQSIRKTNPDCLILNNIDLSMFEHGDKSYIPHRNLIFAALASNFGDEVVIAGVKDDLVEDKNEHAFALMTNVLTETSKKSVVVSSPFWGMTKVEVVRWFLRTVPNPMQLIKDSCSCYSGTSFWCKECRSCFRKNVALYANGWGVPFHNEELMYEYKQNIQNGMYDDERVKHTINYLHYLGIW